MNATRARLRGHSAGLSPRNRRGVGVCRGARLEVVVFLLFLLLVILVFVVFVEIVFVFLVLEFFLFALERYVRRISIMHASDRILIPLLHAVLSVGAGIALSLETCASHFDILTR